MKKILKPLFCAAALVSLAGCNKFDEANATPETSNGSLIKVYAKVAENDGTRANIHVGESAFTAEWEAGDALGILPVKTGGTAPATAAKFDYNATLAAFEGSLNDFAAGGGNYYAFFPHAKVTGTTANLPFGNLRTQAGNDFNSAYDALVATPRAYTADDEAGKADGKDVTFTLHRLTSILNFSIATPADKVKYLLLTAGGETQKLSASSLDFGLENGGAETVASLSTTDQSNIIALQYTPDRASADKVEAFFNVPADLYPTLTLDVIDSDNQMATVTVDRTEAFEAGTLYKKAVDAPQFASIAPPSLVWPNQDMNEPHDITKCGTDYEANIQITVPGGIAGQRFHHGDLCAPVGRENHGGLEHSGHGTALFASQKGHRHIGRQYVRLQSDGRLEGTQRPVHGRRGRSHDRRKPGIVEKRPAIPGLRHQLYLLGQRLQPVRQGTLYP